MSLSAQQRGQEKATVDSKYKAKPKFSWKLRFQQPEQKQDNPTRQPKLKNFVENTRYDMTQKNILRIYIGRACNNRVALLLPQREARSEGSSGAKRPAKLSAPAHDLNRPALADTDQKSVRRNNKTDGRHSAGIGERGT